MISNQRSLMILKSDAHQVSQKNREGQDRGSGCHSGLTFEASTSDPPNISPSLSVLLICRWDPHRLSCFCAFAPTAPSTENTSPEGLWQSPFFLGPAQIKPFLRSLLTSPVSPCPNSSQGTLDSIQTTPVHTAVRSPAPVVYRQAVTNGRATQEILVDKPYQKQMSQSLD